LLDFILSNASLDGEKLLFTLKEPFEAVIAVSKTGKWYTTNSKVYTQLKQEGRRWREILDPMYRQYKLQIRGRD
ncbi:MAG: hypothetical protein ACRD5B_00100, partial [Nitrososphaeraceae archaeon]